MTTTKTVFTANVDTQMWTRYDDNVKVCDYTTFHMYAWLREHAEMTEKITVETYHNAPLT